MSISEIYDTRPTLDHEHGRSLGLIQAVGGDAGVGARVPDDGAGDGEGVILEVVGHALHLGGDLLVVLQPFDLQLVHLSARQHRIPTDLSARLSS